MGFIFNASAWDRGSKLIEDRQKEDRQAKLDERQAELDARERERYDREKTDYNDQKTATSGYLSALKSDPTTQDVDSFLAKRLPQQAPAETQVSPGPAAEGAQPVQADNPVQNNVVTAQPAGSFTGDPRQIQAAIRAIKDPIERANAMSAWQLQMNDPAKNAEALVAGRTQQPLQQMSPPSQGVAQDQSQQAPLATMAATVQQPFQPSPEVMANRNRLIAKAEFVAKTNPGKLPDVQKEIENFDLGVKASEIYKRVIGMDQPTFNELVKRADLNPGIEVKAVDDGKGGTVLTIGEKKVSLTRQQAADWLTGLYLMEHGDAPGGRKVIESVSKDLADVSAKYLSTQLAVSAENRGQTATRLAINADGRATEQAAQNAAAAQRAQMEFDVKFDQLQKDAKVPQAVKAQADVLRENIKTTHAALAKAQAEGSYNPNSDGVKRLEADQATYTAQFRLLMEPYAKTGSGSVGGDFLGIKGSGSAPSAPASQPASQVTTQASTKAASAPTTASNDSSKIYNDALMKMSAAVQSAATPEAKARAQSDEQRMRQEMGRLGIPVTTMAQMLSPTQQDDSAQDLPVTTMAQALPDPLKGRSQTEIRAIAQQLNTERKKWVGNPSASRRVAEIDALLNRINQGQY